jgi:hypothetical protein
LTEEKKDWYATIMDTNGNILIKILDEKYSPYVVTVNNIQGNEQTGGVDFDVLDFPDDLNDDKEFIHQIQLAVGDIVARAITAAEADRANAERTVQDIYFTDILKKHHVHSKVDMTTTQAMKSLKLYPCPIVDEDEILPADDAGIEEYVQNMKGKCDYSVFDLDDNNKEYNMTVEADQNAFIELLKSKGKDYFF